MTQGSVSSRQKRRAGRPAYAQLQFQQQSVLKCVVGLQQKKTNTTHYPLSIIQYPLLIFASKSDFLNVRESSTRPKLRTSLKDEASQNACLCLCNVQLGRCEHRQTAPTTQNSRWRSHQTRPRQVAAYIAVWS